MAEALLQEQKQDVQEEQEENDYSWLSRKCSSRDTKFGIKCKGKMEYDQERMVLICEDCGNEEAII